jgi:hypothetical protein
MRQVLGYSTIVALTIGAASTPVVADCFVAPAPAGNNGNAGTTTSPYATVSYAMSQSPCSSIVLKDGTYNERIKIIDRTAPLAISAEHPFVSTMTASEGAFVDGGAARIDNIPVMRQSAILIYDSANITIKGLRIRIDAKQLRYPDVWWDTGRAGQLGCIAGVTAPPSTTYCNVAGIDIREYPAPWMATDTRANNASSHDIIVTGNEIYNVIASPNGVATRIFDAVPIGVTSQRVTAAGATHHVRVENNIIHDCDINSDTYALPAIAIHQNVEQVRISGNTIYSIVPTAAWTSSGGIDVSGNNYQTGQTSDVFARPRKSVIRKNVIYGLPNGVGIIVNLASDVLIDQNSINNVSHGIQVVNEGCQNGSVYIACAANLRTQRIWVRDNLIARANVAALSISRLGANYDAVSDVYVTNNTIYTAANYNEYFGTGTEISNVYLRSGILGTSAFRNNLIQLDWPIVTPFPFFPIAARLFRRDVSVALPMQMAIDYDLWYVRQAGSFVPPSSQWGSFNWDTGLVSFGSWATHHASYDVHGINANPLLSLTDFKVTSASPTRNAGGTVSVPSWVTPLSGPSNFGDYNNVGNSPTGQTVAESDFFGASRVQGSSIDIGMFEQP